MKLTSPVKSGGATIEIASLASGVTLEIAGSEKIILAQN